MSRVRERALLVLVLLGGPLAFYLLVGRGQVAHLERLTQERKAVEAEFPGPVVYTPVSQAERAALAQPDADWRGRIPFLATEQDRLVHYHTVVSELQRQSREDGAPVSGFRSSWDPIRASFTLPERLPGYRLVPSAEVDRPELRLSSWVLEARYASGPDRALKGLGAAPRLVPLLEPVAFRWEMGPSGAQTALAFRNLYLAP